MYRSTIWPSTSPRARTGAVSISRLVRTIVCAVLALLLVLVAGGATAQADAALVYQESRASYRFSEELTFWLDAQAEASIEEVILFYGIEDTPLVRRIYPAFDVDRQVSIEHRERLEPGQFAPGTRLRYWWRLTLASGEIIDTPIRSFAYTDDARDWQTLSEGRIDLHWYGRNPRQAETLLQVAIAALGRLEDEIGVTTEQRVQIYVYANARDMQPALSTRSDAFDARVTTLGVVVSRDTMLLLGSHAKVDRTLAHELSHVVVGLATDNPYAGLPRWLDEGLAMYAEGELPQGNLLALERAVRDDALLSVRSMTSYSGRADEVDLFYGASYSVVVYMLETYGRDKMQELLQVFREGTHQDTALRRVYGFGLDELDARWRASLGLEPRTLPESPLEERPAPEPEKRLPATWAPYPVLAARLLALPGARVPL